MSQGGTAAESKASKETSEPESDEIEVIDEVYHAKNSNPNSSSGESGVEVNSVNLPREQLTYSKSPPNGKCFFPPMEHAKLKRQIYI